MKIKLYILSTIIFLISSCGNWLDVVPNDSVVETELFKEASGYRNALNGVYKQISKPSLYGKELTWGFIDVMANSYEGLSYGNAYYVATEEYSYGNENVKPFFENFWSISYNSIANCNNLLGNLEKVESSIFNLGQSEYDLIKGEALALRAFLHFDMVRLFAPAPILNNTEAIIPYYEKYPSHGEKAISTNELKEKIIRDLIEARDLVVHFDTLDRNHINWLDNDYRFKEHDDYGQTDDVFFAYRGFRMNYPAITAILARVYNYFGMHEQAKLEAEKVINMAFPEVYGTLFQFTTKGDIVTDGDTKMMRDLIFALSYPKLQDDFNTYVHTASNSPDEFTIAYYDWVFDDVDDFRMKYLTYDPVGDGWSFYCKKHVASGGKLAETVKDIIPVIRLSEMHYIVAEYHASEGNFVEATRQLDMVRKGRNCTIGQLVVNSTDTFIKELLNETKREFMCEGQVFFYYKKFNQRIRSSMKTEYFTFPIPESQKVNF